MLRFIMFVALAGTFGPAFAAPAQASDADADTSDTILVFDASGSMWGQIDGKPKITIAREVVQGLLKDLPPERKLGLVAYGHRRKGDCKDIQTLVPVGTDRAAISKAIADINPKGKTPMTAAVEQAAEALKFSENTATVILVSDGQETCHADPCAAAAKLEQLGIGLTVHTVGFGLTKEEAGAKEQLRCMAEATGGRFFEADDAAQLRDALSQVSAEKPAPVPDTIEATLKATDQDGGPLIKNGLVWTVRHGATGKVIYTSDETGTAHAELPRGVHDVEVHRASDGATAKGKIDVSGKASVTLPIVVDLAASVKAPDTAAAGSKVSVIWEGPDEMDDYITVVKPDSADDKVGNRAPTRHGSPLELLLPPESGDYEVRYVSRKARTVLARQAIDVTEIMASIEVPATAAAGSTLLVKWTGPDYTDDAITIGKVGSAAAGYVNTTPTSHGMPVKLLMPAAPGTYEVRYVQRQGRTILAHEPIEITAVHASVEVPETAAAGSTLLVKWTGPDYTDDAITIGKVESAANKYVSTTPTSHGMPVKLRMPTEPGVYEVRYVQRQDRTVLARKIITITP